MTISESLMSEWRKFADRCTPNTETGSLNYREFATLVRNAALEEAKQLCEARSMSVASRCGYPEGLKVGAQGCAAAIELLKEPTP